jgi:hypothetical protein
MSSAAAHIVLADLAENDSAGWDAPLDDEALLDLKLLLSRPQALS